MTWPNVHAPGRDEGIAAAGRRPSPAGPAGPVTVHYGTTAHTFRISRDLELVKTTSGSHRKAQHSLRVEVTADDTRRRPMCGQLVNLTLTRLARPWPGGTQVIWRQVSDRHRFAAQSSLVSDTAIRPKPYYGC